MMAFGSIQIDALSQYYLSMTAVTEKNVDKSLILTAGVEGCEYDRFQSFQGL